MALLKKLAKITAVVGLVKAADMTVKHYRENNPGGVQDYNGDGAADYKDKLNEAAKAARQTIGDITGTVDKKLRKL